VVDRSWRQLPRRAAGVVDLLRGELLRGALLRGELLLEQLIPVLQMLRLLARDGRRGAVGPDVESFESGRRRLFGCEREVVPLLVRGIEVLVGEQHAEVGVLVRDALENAPLLVHVLHRHGIRHSLVRELAGDNDGDLHRCVACNNCSCTTVNSEENCMASRESHLSEQIRMIQKIWHNQFSLHNVPIPCNFPWSC
jgi:hypothetical protein